MKQEVTTRRFVSVKSRERFSLIAAGGEYCQKHQVGVGVGMQTTGVHEQMCGGWARLLMGRPSPPGVVEEVVVLRRTAGIRRRRTTPSPGRSGQTRPPETSQHRSADGDKDEMVEAFQETAVSSRVVEGDSLLPSDSCQLTAD